MCLMEEWGAQLVHSKHLASILCLFKKIFLNFLAVQQITLKSQWFIPTTICYHHPGSEVWLQFGWSRLGQVELNGFSFGCKSLSPCLHSGAWLKGQQLPRACSSHGGLLEHKGTGQTIKYGLKLLLMPFPWHSICQSKSHGQVQQKYDRELCPQWEALHNHTAKCLDP